MFLCIIYSVRIIIYSAGEGTVKVQKKKVSGKKAEIKVPVILADTKDDLSGAVIRCFDQFGGARALLKQSRDVYIKINAVDLKEFSYTDPEVLRHVIKYFKERGARNIYVIENCTQASFTRLVFKATGITDVCLETGAAPVYLDETEAVPIFLETLQEFIDISYFVYERLVLNREQNLYISIPKLKTHSMSQVTLSIKNQFGFVHQFSRIADHNYRLHQKFADIYRYIRPDFSIVDGIVATNHGHYIAFGNREQCVVPMDLLIAGQDSLAVDTVGAELMGYRVQDVEHLRLCRETGIGVGDMQKIEIINKNLFTERRKNLTHELLDDFPPDLKILRGKERCCKEGCRRNTETVVEVFHRDHGGKGGFTILMGKGISTDDVRMLTGRVHIAGSCAIQEHGIELVKRLGRSNVTMSHGCNNLAETVEGLCVQMKVNPLKLVPINPVSALMHLAKARLKGTKANITPVF